MHTINIEDGFPDVLTSLSTLERRLYAERAGRERSVKIIHGYGSTGRGGAIRVSCRRKLSEYKRRKVIKDFCPGEAFGPFGEEGRRLAAVMPSLRNDPDWGRANDGVTIVLLR